MKQLNIPRALVVSAIVGTVLLIINQHETLLGQAELRIVPALLTYCVPFVVFIVGQLSRQDEEN